VKPHLVPRVDRIPCSPMLVVRQETADPPIRPLRLPLPTRWLVLHFKPWRTVADVIRNLRYLVRG
jgi:hypothetical protein